MRTALVELKQWVDACVNDFKSSDMDASDYAHECADGSQWAIYYGMGWDLVCACHDLAPEKLNVAEDVYDDIFSSDNASLDTRMNRLAYLIAHDALTQALS